MDQSSQTEQAFSTARRQDRRQAQRAAQQNARANQPDNSLTFKDAATFVAEMTPVIGDVMAAKEVYDELQKDEPNYYLAGALGGAAVLGLVPGVGDAAAQAVKKGAREVFDVVKRLDVDTNTVGSMGGNVRLKPKEPFNKTRSAYRIATQAEDGKLYPLFVNASDEIPVGEWVSASVPPVTFKGSNGNMYVPSKGAARSKGEKAKATGDMQTLPDKETADQLREAGFPVEKPSKSAPFGKVRAVASRPGFHATTKPVAHHLGPEDLIISSAERDKLLKAGVTPKAFKAKTFNYLDGKLIGKKKVSELSAEDKKRVKSQKKYYVKRRAEDQVFVEVDMADDTSDDLLKYMQERNRTDIDDKLPSGGSYTYQDGQADAETWVVGGDMKVKRVLSREEAKAAQEAAGVKDLPHRDEVEEILGRKFAKGGFVGEKTMYTGQQDSLIATGMADDLMQSKDNQTARAFGEGGALMSGNTDRDLEADYEALRSIGEDPKDMMPEEVSMMNAAREGGKLGVTYLQLLARKMGFDITPTKGNRKGFSEGGYAVEDQMARVMQSGGLADDGMNQDPVSGNDIPSGSLAEEVRDDIPAQLSEGEYVVPADVVRYYGVRYFEDLRDEAKQGLTQMEEDGRIGGEPVMPDGITEEDLAQLDEMVATGMANGGLLDKLSYAAQNDPTVNQMLNQGGMTVGFSEGGMTQSLYSDPTQIDQVINQVMQAARDNPGIMEQLASRGIQINRTEPQMPPQTMDQANPPPETRQAMSEGGVSSLGSTQPDVPLDTQSPEYFTSPTGISPMFAVPGGSYTYAGGEAPAPVEAQPVCGEGYTYDEEKKMCVPVAAAPVQTRQSSSSDSDGGYTPPPTDDGEGGSMFADWGQDLDFTDPDSVLDWAKDLSEPMKGNKFIKTGAILAGGPVGALVGAGMTGSSLKDISDLRAAALIAEARGDTKLAESLNGFADDRVKASSGIVGMIEDIAASGTQKAESYAQRLGYESLEDAKEDGFRRKPTTADKPSSTEGGSGSGSGSSSAPASSPRPRSRPSNDSNRSSGVSSISSDRGRATGIDTSKATAGVATTGRTDSSGKKAGDSGYKSALKERQEDKKKNVSPTGSDVAGTPFAKGGLMKRTKK